jgi:serine/threonine protein kinase
MSVDSSANLVNALHSTQLLAPAQLDAVIKDLHRRFPDAKSLARALIEREWLTPYQVNLLLQGSGDKLVLGPYIIVERLGDNALGQVYKARHHLMNRLVTLTIVREELLSQPKAVEQFYQEIQAASQLSDPYIVHAYDAGPIGQTHFFAQEFVEGIDLEKLVQQSGRLPAGTAALFIRQAAKGLQHAYERGLLHHDLRPANLLVAKAHGPSTSVTTKTPLPSSSKLNAATIKIYNMGLTLLQPKTRKGQAAGAEDALDYMAPEQGAQGNRVTDIRSNLYSLGCIFYYLLAGRAPFAGSSSSVKLSQHQKEQPKPLESLRNDVPAQISTVVHSLLAKRPEDRIQTPAELLTALAPANLSRTASDTMSSDGATTSTWPALSGAQALLGGKRWLWLIGGGVAVLLLFILLVALLVRSLAGKAEQTKANAGFVPAPAPILPRYTKKATREETILATLRDSGYPSLEGKWYSIGPFDHKDKKGFDTAFPPESEIDLNKTYTGKENLPLKWKEVPNFRPGEVRDLKPLSEKYQEWAVIYLYHEIEAPQQASMEVSLGSDDTLTVWLNGKVLIANNVYRVAAPDQDFTTLHLQPGKNQLLAKICQGTGDWKFYIFPRWPESLKTAFQTSLQRDFASR